MPLPTTQPITSAPSFALVRQTSARPLSIRPSDRPEEQLFRDIKQSDDNVVFVSRFEEDNSERVAFEVIDDRLHMRSRLQTNSIAAATALPIVPLPTTRAPPTKRHKVPARRLLTPTTTSSPEYEYEYEYYYTYDEENGADDEIIAEGRSSLPVASIDDYDLGQISNKVSILENGKTVCHDVGVFPHPLSCRKFVMCSRRAARQGITGWVYECPSYLAFDPVGQRCNWATDVVCT